MSGDHRLFVEGKLDSELLNPVLAQGWQVTPVKDGGKRALKPRTYKERQDNLPFKTYYLRDRDFDFDPDTAAGQGPYDMGDDLGFRWSRHEIENYMIDPLIVREAANLDDRELHDYRGALVYAGNRIYHYQTARWVVGTVRCGLPLPRELQTHPSDIDPDRFDLPKDLEREPVRQWAIDSTDAYRNQVHECLTPQSVEQVFEEKEGIFGRNGFMSVDNILVWFSGKDLLSALREWLSGNRQGDPGFFRSKIRDWMISNPSEVLHRLTEWQHLVDVLDRA